jgi:hypothetical protein
VAVTRAVCRVTKERENTDHEISFKSFAKPGRLLAQHPLVDLDGMPPPIVIYGDVRVRQHGEFGTLHFELIFRRRGRV